jgi:uncharacterized protein (DUF58 family)
LNDAARLDALALAGDLPGVLLDAKRLAASAPGVHGRRRSGQGEAFWQYRDHRAEDGARLVDWRRSAFWLDPERGFNWTSDPARTTKLRRAQTIALALATLLQRGGERVGAMGVAPRTGPRAVDRLAHDFLLPVKEAEPPPRSCIIFLSDFYAPVEMWRDRLSACADVGAAGALVMVSDPAEDDFPFRGRTLFLEPGGRRETLLGRAEAAREVYTERLETHRRAIRALGAEFGFPALLHRTDHGASPALAMLIALVAERFA